MKSQLPYLIRIGDKYHFRIKIPSDLHERVGIIEFKRSLPVNDLNQAGRLAIILAAKAKAFFYHLKGNLAMLPDEANKALRATIEEELTQARNYFETQQYDSPDELDTQIQIFEDEIGDLREAYSRDDFSYASDFADQIIKKAGLKIKKNTAQYFLFCKEIMYRRGLLFNAKIRLAEGEEIPIDKIYPASEAAARYIVPSASGFNQHDNGLKNLMEKYSQEKAETGAWDHKLVAKFKHLSDLILETIGDIPVDQVRHKDLMDFRDRIIRELPPHMNKSPLYKDKPLQQILKIKNKAKLSMTTINGFITIIAGFFTWVTAHDYVQKNPANGLRFKVKGISAADSRDTYSPDDLQKILNELAKLPAGKPSRYWIPLIAMFSGMRQTEIAQLYVEDIVDKHGTRCFDINENAPDKKIKSVAAKRLVPIHPVLLDLGLIEYVDTAKKARNKRLWPDLKKARDGYGQYFQRWYGRFNRNKITGDKKRVFHSFRHGFTNQLKQAGVPEEILAELVGHSRRSITMERYGKKYITEVLMDYLKKLDYGIDLTVLQKRTDRGSDPASQIKKKRS